MARTTAWRVLVLLFLLCTLAGPAWACVGDGCLNIYATAGGALTTTWDFDNRPVQTHCVSRRLCDEKGCLYNAIDPGFIHGPAPVPEGLSTVADGTRVSLEVVARDAAVTFRLNNEPLDVGEVGLVGTTPDLHNHPAWQLRVLDGAQGRYPLAFKLITDSPAHEDSETFTIFLEASTSCPLGATPTATPAPTRTPGGPVCPGDCNGDDAVTVDEVVDAVGAALGDGGACDAMDVDDDGAVSVSDLVMAINSALYGCDSGPPPVKFTFIQDTIFTPRCAVASCHDDSAAPAGDLVLEARSSYEQLVGVVPAIDVARDAGYLRIDPGVPENSFLLVKLDDPPLIYGSPMPLVGDPLTADEIALIRNWIAAGAEP